MRFGEAVATGFRKYADFRGYATPPEYWWWALFVFLVSVPGKFIGSFGHAPAVPMLVALALLLPSASMLVRRLRDAGYHWAFALLALVPLVGPLLLLVPVCRSSKPHFDAPMPAEPVPAGRAWP